MPRCPDPWPAGRDDRLGGLGQCACELGVARCQFPAHPGVLPALTGEQEQHPSAAPGSDAEHRIRGIATVGDAAQRVGGILGVRGQDRAAKGVRQGAAGRGQGRKRDRFAGDRGGPVIGGIAKFVVVAAGQCDQNRCRGFAGSGLRLGLAEHDMSIGAAETERADPGTAQSIRLGGPVHRFGGYPQPAFRQSQQRILAAKVDGGRYDSVLQTQRHLGETGDPGGCLQMADIRFDGPDETG